MRLFKVEFEYDFGGSFGGNNNQDVYQIDNDDMTLDEIIDKIEEDVLARSGCDEDDRAMIYIEEIQASSIE